MIETIAKAGMLSACVLIALLAISRMRLRAAIWPTPGAGTWQSILFWTLFRVANVSALVVAAMALAELSPGNAFSAGAIRIAAAMVAMFFLALYGLALFTLGRPNTYCGEDGLVKGGIYAWTRNPQYSTIIPFYAALAMAADTPWLYAQSAALIAIYVLMALNEEPWLRARYGAAYDAYCAEVSRFFTWRRLEDVVRDITARGSRTPGRH